MADILWCCHVRGPDEIYAAPDYDVALRWCDLCLEMDRRPRVSENEPYLSAVPAPWPHSVESYIKCLPDAARAFGTKAQWSRPRLTESGANPTKAPS